MTLSDLARHIPHQRIAQAFTPRTRSAGEYAGVLSLGMVAGAALTLLLAPKARGELRRKCSELVSGLRKGAQKRRLVNGHAEERADSPT
ncbi:MAG: hypothetical protein WEF50_17460 [Myxococcota bacterium]